MRKLLWLCTLIFFSCGASRMQGENTATIVPTGNDTIVFLMFKMTKNPGSGKNALTFLDKTESTGTMKKNPDNQPDAENYLTIEVFQNDRLSETLFVSHPLFKHVEYLDDTNNYISKNIELEEEDFFFRLPTKNQPLKIRVSETLKNQSKTELATFKI